MSPKSRINKRPKKYDLELDNVGRSALPTGTDVARKLAIKPSLSPNGDNHYIGGLPANANCKNLNSVVAICDRGLLYHTNPTLSRVDNYKIVFLAKF